MALFTKIYVYASDGLLMYVQGPWLRYVCWSEYGLPEKNKVQWYVLGKEYA